MKTHAFLIAALSLFLGSSYATTEEKSPEKTTVLDPLFTDATVKVRGPASVWPEAIALDLGKDFSVEEPDRGPASVAKKKPRSTAKSNKGRRSRLPASINDGIEFRVRYNGLISTFWVVKRADKYDLLYSNSAGSKASVGLSNENFDSIHGFARGFRAGDANITKCANAAMQAHVVEGGQEKTVSACVAGKSRSADDLRQLGGLLSSLVR